MTTAARPTFDPARGGSGKAEGDLSSLSKQYSSRDLPSHTKLKYRQPGQGTVNEHSGRDYRKELDDRERTSRDSKRNQPYNKRLAGQEIQPKNLDADDPIEADDDSGNSDDSDEEDDTAELLAELNKIKKERAAEKTFKEIEKKAEAERIRTENILRGNPLIQQTQGQSDFRVKRRWDDDVVFKNCAKDDNTKEGRFINDTLRSEFHKKFMDKYVK